MPLDVGKLNAEELRNLMANAKRLGDESMYASAFAQLCRVLPNGASDGTLSDDVLVQKFWKAVHAAEQIKTDQNGKTTRLSRTRQKVAKDGIIVTMESLALKPKPSDGFAILLGHNLPELVFEHIIAEHPARFSETAVIAARQRLTAHGIPLP